MSGPLDDSLLEDFSGESPFSRAADSDRVEQSQRFPQARIATGGIGNGLVQWFDRQAPRFAHRIWPDWRTLLGGDDAFGERWGRPGGRESTRFTSDLSWIYESGTVEK